MGKYQIWLDEPLMPGNFRPVSGTYACWNNLYLGNKMTGKPFFNAPWFDASAAVLLSFPTVQAVFNPAQHDRDLGLDPMKCPTGSPDEARVFNLPVGKCLADDWAWIAASSNGMIAGPDWMDSPGTISEIACHQALRLPVWEFQVFCAYWDKDHLYDLALPPIMELGGPPYCPAPPWEYQRYMND